MNNNKAVKVKNSHIIKKYVDIFTFSVNLSAHLTNMSVDHSATVLFTSHAQ